MIPKLLQTTDDGRLSRPQLWLVGTATLDAVVLLFGVYLATRPAASGCPELPERFGRGPAAAAPPR